MIIKHFDSVWEQSKPWEETAPVYWQKKYSDALRKNPGNEPKKILLQISAQHPLKNGVEPDEEFEGRLKTAIALYTRWAKEGKQVTLYVPGSRHKTENGEDNIPLSDAGKNFLLQQGIPPADILGEETNQLYKGTDGVYNSADECYVSSQIYKNGHYDRLCCICSPLQTVKNSLYFIENGVLPSIYAVPSEQPFHEPYEESAVILPEILYYDHSWQGKTSCYGNRSRKERRPEPETKPGDRL